MPSMARRMASIFPPAANAPRTCSFVSGIDPKIDVQKEDNNKSAIVAYRDEKQSMRIDKYHGWNWTGKTPKEQLKEIFDHAGPSEKDWVVQYTATTRDRCTF